MYKYLFLSIFNEYLFKYYRSDAKEKNQINRFFSGYLFIYIV